MLDDKEDTRPNFDDLELAVDKFRDQINKNQPFY